MSTEVVRAGVVGVALLLRKELEKRKKRESRKVWVKNWVGRREKYGASSTLLKELKDEDPVSCWNILRLGGAQFDALLQMIDGMINKQDTKIRIAITTATNLEITLRYLATGDSFKSLEYLFRISEPTILLFVPEVLTAISHVLKPFIKVSENKVITN